PPFGYSSLVQRNHMVEDSTIVAGIEIPSTDLLFLTVVIAIHIPLGLACVAAGASAMLSKKGRGRHSKFGKTYFWCLLALFASATLLSFMRWAENYHLFVLGGMSFASAWLGRTALRKRWPYWARLHIAGMGLSYVLMLIAFYVDNGKQLPLWKDLPHFMYWLLPLAVGTLLIVRALLTHPIVEHVVLLDFGQSGAGIIGADGGIRSSNSSYHIAVPAESRKYVHIAYAALTFGECHPRLCASRSLRGAFMRRREGGAGPAPAGVVRSCTPGRTPEQPRRLLPGRLGS